MKSISTYQRIIALLLLLIYALNPFKVLQPYLSYKINYTYISSVLCENKNKPSIGCNGKCHLAKELKKAAQQESENNKSVSQNSEVHEIIVREMDYQFTPFVVCFDKEYAPFLSLFASRCSDLLAPPPEV